MAIGLAQVRVRDHPPAAGRLPFVVGPRDPGLGRLLRDAPRAGDRRLARPRRHPGDTVDLRTLVDVAPVPEGGQYPVEWAKSCGRFNQSVLDYLKDAPSVKTVVSSSPFTRYVGYASWKGPFRLAHVENGLGPRRRSGGGARPGRERETVSRVQAFGERPAMSDRLVRMTR